MKPPKILFFILAPVGITILFGWLLGALLLWFFKDFLSTLVEIYTQRL
jgi:hypothetical protein